MPEQKKSVLLTPEENDLIFDLLGYKCLTMATTVVELYTTAGPTSDEWQYKETGVLCLIKDSSRKAYFFRLYCPIRRRLLWEHEIYNEMQYLAPAPFLHTFEAENCIAGFNLANEEEGKNLRKLLLDTLESKKQRRVDRRNRYNSMSANKAMQDLNGGPNFNVVVNPIVQYPLKKNLTRKDGKKKVSKADIGTPHNFRHVSHVGWDPHKGFDVDKVDDPQLIEFFNQAGVSENHLKDRETREFIYDFIIKHGGIEKVKEEIVVEPPPIPQRVRSAPPRPPAHQRTLGPPPPPPPPQRIQPPRTLPATPKQETVSAVDVGCPPPPPPPPPPPGPFPPPGPAVNIEGNNKSALMHELTTNMKQLKPLNLDRDNEDKKLPPIVSDSHFQLMDQIKEGIKLKPVTTTTSQSPTVPSSGLASALAKALAERSKVIHSDSDSTSDSDQVDDEWDN